MSDYPNRPLVGVGVVVFKGDRVLLVRRGKPPRQGRWSLPGGRQRLGEAVRETASREVREETGLEVEVTALLDVLASHGRVQCASLLMSGGGGHQVRTSAVLGRAPACDAHPLVTQAVTYIVQRMAQMAALFYLLGIYLYLNGRLTQNPTQLLIVRLFYAQGDFVGQYDHLARHDRCGTYHCRQNVCTL